MVLTFHYLWSTRTQEVQTSTWHYTIVLKTCSDELYKRFPWTYTVFLMGYLGLTDSESYHIVSYRIYCSKSTFLGAPFGFKNYNMTVYFIIGSEISLIYTYLASKTCSDELHKLCPSLIIHTYMSWRGTYVYMCRVFTMSGLRPSSCRVQLERPVLLRSTSLVVNTTHYYCTVTSMVCLNYLLESWKWSFVRSVMYC